MCGIAGGIGKIDYRSYLLDSLRKLDYRGYDSAGIAYSHNGEIKLFKTPGRVDDLEKILPLSFEAELGIAHTRWATHGEPNEINSHPHRSMNGQVVLVHNGVIENFLSIKKELSDEGYSFISDTDSEVVVNFLEREYLSNGKDGLKAIRSLISALVGSFSLAILFKGEERLYFAKRGSPLLLGKGKGAMYLSSDSSPMSGFVSGYMDLDDDTYGYLEKDSCHIYSDEKEIEPKFVEKRAIETDTSLHGYPHYMLKEIEQSPEAIENLLKTYSGEFWNGRRYTFNKGMIEEMKKSDCLIFIACGTSHYASLIGVDIARAAGLRAEAYIASEWGYYPIVDKSCKKPFFIILSQSGETADAVMCEKEIKKMGHPILAITNSGGSTIERGATYFLHLECGREVAVAATKSFVSQVCILTMLLDAALGGTSKIKEIGLLKDSIEDLISRKEEIKDIASKMHRTDSVFFVGRGKDFSSAKEAALKLKEVSYIHSEAYPAGELKHGPIAMIEEGTTVFCFLSEKRTALLTRNNIIEMKARGASSYIVSTESNKEDEDAFVVKEAGESLSSVLMVVFSQYLTYFVALLNGLPIDKPRNLAKSVTVQ